MASAYGLPEDLWIWILVLAVIILAFLWKDKISSGSGGGGSSTTTTTDDDPPSVRMSLVEDKPKKGGTFRLTGGYDSGDATISTKNLKMEYDGEDKPIDLSSWGGGSFSAGPEDVPDADKVTCTIYVSTRYGEDKDIVSFRPTEPGEPAGPTLNVEVTTKDADESEANGEVKITASPTEGDASIKGTVVDAGGVGQQEKSGSADCVFEQDGLPPGDYPFMAATEDRNGKTEEVERTFTIGVKEKDGGGGSRGGGPGGFLLNNNQNEIINEFNVPAEMIELLKQIIDQTDQKAGGDVTQEVNMEGYHLLLAMHMLQNDLDSGDNQQVISLLQDINNELQSNQLSADDLENSLRAVLHQVFDQDIEGVLEDLDISGDFDEDRIVQAIQNNDVDIGPLVNRLSNIENAIQQLQNQGGGDFSDIEAKLDQLVTAVKDSKMDEDMMQQFISQLGDLQSKGVDVDIGDVGNNNGADVDNLMMMRLMDDVREKDNPGREMDEILEVIREQGRLNRELLRELIEKEEDGGGPSNKNPDSQNGSMSQVDEVEYRIAEDTKKEIEELEQAFRGLEKLEEDEREELQITQHVEEDVEKLVGLLKDVRKHEHKIEQLLSNEITQGEWQKVGKHEEKIQSDLKEARAYLEDFMESIANIEDLYKDNDQVLSQLEDLKDEVVTQQDELSDLDSKLQDTVQEMKNYRQQSKASQNY